MKEVKYPEIARRFQYIMSLRNVKAGELAHKLKINPATISHYMNGNRCPSTEIALQIGKALRCNPIWLMDLDDNMEVQKPEFTVNYSLNCDFSKDSRLNEIAKKLERIPEDKRQYLLDIIEGLIGLSLSDEEYHKQEG